MPSNSDKSLKSVIKKMKTYDKKTIIDLSDFINSLTRQHHEVILGIDANESNILYNNGVSQLLHCTNSLM